MFEKDNKKILIVGSNYSFLREKLGNKIDSYDEVIRVNLYKEEFKDYIGTKTTIWSLGISNKDYDKFLETYKILKRDVFIKEVWFTGESVMKSRKSYLKMKKHISEKIKIMNYCNYSGDIYKNFFVKIFLDMKYFLLGSLKDFYEKFNFKKDLRQVVSSNNKIKKFFKKNNYYPTSGFSTIINALDKYKTKIDIVGFVDKIDHKYIQYYNFSEKKPNFSYKEEISFHDLYLEDLFLLELEKAGKINIL